MALQWQVINIPIDGIDNTQPYSNQGTREVRGIRFLRQGEGSPSYVFDKVLDVIRDPQRVFFIDEEVVTLNTDRAYVGQESEQTAPSTDLGQIDSGKILLASHEVFSLPPQRAYQDNAPTSPPTESYSYTATASAFGACIDDINSIHFIAWFAGASGSVNSFSPLGAIVSQDCKSVISICRSFNATSNYQEFTPTMLSSVDNIRCFTFPGSLVFCVAYITGFGGSPRVINFDQVSYTIPSLLGANAAYFTANNVGPESFLTTVFSITVNHPTSNTYCTFDVCDYIVSNAISSVKLVAYTTLTGVALSVVNSSGVVTTDNIAAPTLSTTDNKISVYHNKTSDFIYMFWTATSTGNQSIFGAIYTLNAGLNTLTQILAPTLLHRPSGSASFIASIACAPGYFDDSVTGLMATVGGQDSGGVTLTGRRYSIYFEFYDSLTSTGTITNASNVTVTSKSFSSLGDVKSKAYFYCFEPEYFSGGLFFNEKILGIDCQTSKTITGKKVVNGGQFVSVATIGISRTGSQAISQVSQIGNDVLKCSVELKTGNETQEAIGLLNPANYSRVTSPIVRHLTLNAASTGSKIAHFGRNYINAGALYEYDGDKLTDTGFSLSPNVVAEYTASSGGSIPINTSTTFKFVYYTEIAGRRDIFGPPSVEYTYTSPSSGTGISLTLYIYASSPVRFDAYSVLIYIKDPSSGNFYFNQAVQFLSNISLATVLFSATPAASTSNPQIYTDFGELPNVISGGPRCVQSTSSRLMLIDDFGVVNVSKPNNQTRGVEFSDLLIVQQPSDLESTNATGVIDNNFILFGKRNIYAISGEFPDSFGNGASPQWTKIQTDVSCTNHQSVLSTSDGVFFDSTRGLMILDRGLSINPVGAKIFETYANQPSLSFQQWKFLSACFNYKNSEAMFLREDGFIYFFNTKFGTFSRAYPGLGGDKTCIGSSLGGTLAFGELDIGGFFAFPGAVWLSTNNYNNSILHLGNDQLQYDTGWVPFFGGEQYGRCRRIGILFGLNNLDSSLFVNPYLPTITITIYYDYDNAIFTTKTFSLSPNLPFPDGISYASNGFSINMRTEQQKMRAARVSVSVNPMPYASIRGFSFEVAPKNGVQKNIVAQTG
jgi:hypothetical protein